MRKYAAAGLVLTVLLFGGAYLAAGGPAAEPEPAAPETAAVHHDRDVTLTIQDGDTTEQMTLERYLTGVVRGEMPASFEMEALRAQAAAERSYVYYQLAAGRKDAHPDADFCTDHTCCSAYLSETAAREKWGGDFAPWNTRVEQAVSDTDGQVVLYNGRPILAVFHSSSAGRTAAAGDVWSGDLPYLVSVDSPEGEETVPNYYSTVTFTAAEAKEKLLAAHPELKLSGTPDRWFGAAAENGSGRVETVSVGGTDIEGTELRRIFGLRSACFTVAADSESVTFRVTGYGHGVGMSQYGANQLAREGKTWQEILEWYYTGATVGNA
ncbi:MAG: stage II sporulation protein D [Oscillospiraceae bacterium]|uniref:stage II sporulation protein D n=1 Tax=Vescimonas sp. TaxID=2892404 RepID=UPI001B4D6102|nr:stage II sporulation protein D [Vescimonas sp.]MBP3632620.1 stage II sporulation protein D [Oscillospiraceae bacterium]MDY5334603.1 stage II sporulation protein D [Vescimonas sp.]